MLSIAPGAALALGARVAPRVAPRVARRASPPPRLLVVVAGSDPLKDLSNLDKDLAKVSPSAMADALSGDDREARTQAVIGIGGTAACGVMAWSLLTLRDTGCGLPPGPLGLVGAAEGVSYLYVLALVAWSAAKKVRTGSGLPEGPGGVLGLAEGLAYLLALAGVAVLVGQVHDFGFLPNAVPVEGGPCFAP